MMTSHLALSREGHLDQVRHMFSCLTKHPNVELSFDAIDPMVEENMFEKEH